MTMKGKIVSINVSAEKKGLKKQIPTARLIKDAGLEGDAYNKPPDRQISIVSAELIREQSQCPRAGTGTESEVGAGSFKETITTEGLDLSNIKAGDIFMIGQTAKVEISEKGMTCWEYCPWGRLDGECPLPKNFLFARVLVTGAIADGDEIVRL
jgi:MOSC domain-containing protein YiiM